MKKKLLILPLLFMTTSCIPAIHYAKINYNANDIEYIKVYEVDRDSEIENWEGLKTARFFGYLDESFFEPLMDQLVVSKYDLYLPLASPTPNFYFYDTTIYIKYINNQFAVLCPHRWEMYDSDNKVLAQGYGHNDVFETVMQEALNHLK